MSTVGGAATARAPKSPETREQKSWYWYDWANSAYVTTTATVLFAPYLTSVATAAAISARRMQRWRGMRGFLVVRIGFSYSRIGRTRVRLPGLALPSRAIELES